MKFWITLFVVLLILLDILWMLDGFLNVQYGELLSNNSALNSTTTMALQLFSDKPLVSLYYRIIISLLVLISGILSTIMIRRIYHYRDRLTDSNQKYRALFMEMKSGFALRRIFRNEAGEISEIRFIEENPAFRIHTGVDAIDLKGKSVHEIFGENNQNLIKEYDKISRNGGSFTKIHHAARTGKTLRITAYQHEEDVFATIVDDITKEKEIENELIESYQLKDIIMDTVSESICYLDKELRIVWANKKAQELNNLSAEDIVGHKCHELWCGDSKNCENCPALRTLSSYKTEKEEFHNHKGRYLLAYSNPVFNTEMEIKGIVITLTDMTEWMDTIASLQRKQMHLNLALEVGEMIPWEWDANRGSVILEQSVYLSDEEKNNWKLDELEKSMHPDDKAEFLKQAADVQEGKRSEIQVETRFMSTRKNKWVWFNLLGRIKERNEQDNSLRMTGITYNIDQLKRTALELKKTNEELTELKEKLEKEVEIRLNELREKDLLMIRQSRQAAMGEMIGNIAHQWRQPLNSVAVIIQDLVDAWDFGEITRDYIIEKVNLGMSIINHMSNTIDDFRDFFSPDKMPSEFRLDEQVTKTINILKDMFTSLGIKIETDLDAITITSYSREFSQVLINILNNAKDAIQQNQVEKALIIVTLKTKADKVIVSVSDNAGGIANDIIDKVFDPYFTTKQISNGTGVGLYMSKNIIEKHIKGKILADNTETGAIFTIILDKKLS